MSSPWSSVSLLRPTLEKTWSVYLADTDVLSYWYVGFIGRRRSARCRWNGGIWQCWVKVSAVTWHARLQQLRHTPKQDRCAKHLAHLRFPRILHWWKWARCRRIWQRLLQNPFFTLHCMISHRGHTWSLPASHSSPRRHKVSKSKSCLPHQTTCFLHILRANL